MKIVVGGLSNYPCLVYLRPKGVSPAAPLEHSTGGWRDFASLTELPRKFPPWHHNPCHYFGTISFINHWQLDSDFLPIPKWHTLCKWGFLNTPRRGEFSYFTKTNLPEIFIWGVVFPIEIPATTFCGISVFHQCDVSGLHSPITTLWFLEDSGVLNRSSFGQIDENPWLQNRSPKGWKLGCPNVAGTKGGRPPKGHQDSNAAHCDMWRSRPGFR